MSYCGAWTNTWYRQVYNSSFTWSYSCFIDITSASESNSSIFSNLLGCNPVITLLGITTVLAVFQYSVLDLITVQPESNKKWRFPVQCVATVFFYVEFTTCSRGTGVSCSSMLNLPSVHMVWVFHVIITRLSLNAIHFILSSAMVYDGRQQILEPAASPEYYW